MPVNRTQAEIGDHLGELSGNRKLETPTGLLFGVRQLATGRHCRKVEFKLFQPGLVCAIEQGHSGRSCFRAIRTRPADRRWRQAGSQVRRASHKCCPDTLK